jgi:hypothetical protein
MHCFLTLESYSVVKGGIRICSCSCSAHQVEGASAPLAAKLLLALSGTRLLCWLHCRLGQQT